MGIVGTLIVVSALLLLLRLLHKIQNRLFDREQKRSDETFT